MSLKKSQDICEQDVYQSLFFKYSEHLRNFIYSKSGDLQLSEDIVQETFVRLWIKCALIIFAKAKSFLFTVAHHLFLDQVKHNKVVLEYAGTHPQNTYGSSPEDILREKEFKQKIEDAINAMSDKSREVFMMSKMEGLKYREIAERLELSIKAVEKRMSKALEIFNNMT